ncbi:hypothetical protein V1599_04230 [Enterobacter sp. ECC-175]|uniref:hypothetical protein n=1 Tax=unclassified Enterobacter TaxID=2608935 RepID=UPI0011BD54C6|nr:hypothetical protein [Enterobacter sp. RIT 418]
MNIHWFTQPQNSYASCYLYNTETHAFCRVRIELNRNDEDGTFVSFYPSRAVGFVADGQNYRTSQNARWSINDEHRLRYDGTVLPQDPREGYTVFDSTTPARFVHRGNAITVTPRLPAGITQEDMVELARLVMLERPAARVQLTARDASAETLRDAILDAIRARR